MRPVLDFIEIPNLFPPTRKGSWVFDAGVECGDRFPLLERTREMDHWRNIQQKKKCSNMY
jgi:hypothetical protein